MSSRTCVTAVPVSIVFMVEAMASEVRPSSRASS